MMPRLHLPCNWSLPLLDEAWMSALTYTVWGLRCIIFSLESSHPWILDGFVQ